jgi:hypothetical protein
MRRSAPSFWPDRPARVRGSGRSRQEDQVQGQAVHLRSRRDGHRVREMGHPPGARCAGKSDHAPVLQKQETTATEASAGAGIRKVKNLTLTELGFDYEAGGHCGAGAPRFNVTLTTGATFFSAAHTATSWAPTWAVASSAWTLDVNGKLMGKPGNSKN